jgi:hypothetical protein
VKPELPDADPALFTSPLFGDFTPAPERPDPPHVETMTPEERSVHDALLPIGDFGVVARHVTKALIADGWTFAAALVTDAGLREDELDEGRLGLALHRIYCQQNAPMHSEPHHSAKRIAAEYAALSRQAEKETA